MHASNKQNYYLEDAWLEVIIVDDMYSCCIAVSKVRATANENRSQITCYAMYGDCLFITYYVLKSIDHTISVQHLCYKNFENCSSMSDCSQIV